MDTLSTELDLCLWSCLPEQNKTWNIQMQRLGMDNGKNVTVSTETVPL